MIEDRHPFTLHCGWDGWNDIEDLELEALPFGLWGVVIDIDRYRGRSQLNFTRRYGERWEGQDHLVEIVEQPRVHTLVHMHAHGHHHVTHRRRNRRAQAARGKAAGNDPETQGAGELIQPPSGC